MNLNLVTNSIFPDNVTPFVNQVAGHEFTKAKPTIGMMKHSDGYVLKPVPHPIYGIREINFYKNMQTTADCTLLKLKEFAPHFLGTTIIELNGKELDCICMEDVTNLFKYPCVMDIKIGLQTWEPGASEEKILAEGMKYAEVKEHWGFCIPGFQYYNLDDGKFDRRGKDYGKRMTATQAIQALYNFINGKTGIKCGLVENVLCQLREIRLWFMYQRQYLFYASSILLAYDAKQLKAYAEAHEDGWRNSGDKGDKESSFKISVYMIDFAHVLPNKEGVLDQNYCTSLDKLIEVFERLDELYELHQ